MSFIYLFFGQEQILNEIYFYDGGKKKRKTLRNTFLSETPVVSKPEVSWRSFKLQDILVSYFMVYLSSLCADTLGKRMIFFLIFQSVTTQLKSLFQNLSLTHPQKNLPVCIFFSRFCSLGVRLISSQI